jgi:hypothetical protein
MTRLSKFKSGLVTAAVLAGVAGLNSGSGHAGEFSSASIVRPMAGLSFVIGSKQAVGYYLPQRGGCDLMLIIGETSETAKQSDAPARFSTFVAAGRTARMDTADGPSVKFFCSTGASFLTTRIIERLAYQTPAVR